MKASDRIATMVHAFDDAERKHAVREIAERVKRLEAIATRAEQLVEDCYQTEDGQATVVDPARRYQLKEALDELAALDEKGGA